MSTHDRQGTPPFHPAYGVELTDETITALVRHSTNDLSAVPKISRFPSDMSFNNRIYEIHIGASLAFESTKSFVLKVNGRFFGASKIENEIASLMLLERFCPNIPVPRVVAWSRDGVEICSRGGEREGARAGLSCSVGGNPAIGTETGWILMTMLPGSPMDVSSLSPDERAGLSRQVASLISSWRQSLPKSSVCGNIHLQAHSSESADLSYYQHQVLGDQELHIYGIIGSANDSCPPIASLLEYWETELERQFCKLFTKSADSANHEALPPRLLEFLQITLPSLPIFQQAQTENTGFMFTHTDLLPRNLLVSDFPPKIVGIVDFEFSGFFPWTEQFAHEWTLEHDEFDWPEDMHDSILTELGTLGHVTPRELSESDKEQIKWLYVLRKRIAPWSVGPGAEASDEGNGKNESRIEMAREEVLRAIKELERLVLN